MAAIMLEREEAGEQGAGGNGKQQAQPVSLGRQPEHEGNKREERNGGCNELDNGAPVVGAPVEIAVGRQLLGLQPQLRRKLRFVQNVQVVPQCAELILPLSVQPMAVHVFNY